jgi:hypothetical protein
MFHQPREMAQERIDDGTIDCLVLQNNMGGETREGGRALPVCRSVMSGNLEFDKTAWR